MSELHQEEQKQQQQEEATQKIEQQVGGSTTKAPVKIKNIGKKPEVWRGLAKRTSGGLRKEDLILVKMLLF
jgi:hypothetical protein